MAFFWFLFCCVGSGLSIADFASSSSILLGPPVGLIYSRQLSSRTRPWCPVCIRLSCPSFPRPLSVCPKLNSRSRIYSWFLVWSFVSVGMSSLYFLPSAKLPRLPPCSCLQSFTLTIFFIFIISDLCFSFVFFAFLSWLSVLGKRYCLNSLLAVLKSECSRFFFVPVELLFTT